MTISFEFFGGLTFSDLMFFVLLLALSFSRRPFKNKGRANQLVCVRNCMENVKTGEKNLDKRIECGYKCAKKLGMNNIEIE